MEEKAREYRAGNIFVYGEDNQGLSAKYYPNYYPGFDRLTPLMNDMLEGLEKEVIKPFWRFDAMLWNGSPGVDPFYPADVALVYTHPKKTQVSDRLGGPNDEFVEVSQEEIPEKMGKYLAKAHLDFFNNPFSSLNQVELGYNLFSMTVEEKQFLRSPIVRAHFFTQTGVAFLRFNLSVVDYENQIVNSYDILHNLQAKIQIEKNNIDKLQFLRNQPRSPLL